MLWNTIGTRQPYALVKTQVPQSWNISTCLSQLCSQNRNFTRNVGDWAPAAATHIYILSSLKGAYHLEVVESKWIVLFHSSNDISVYALPQWEIPVERSVPAVETTLFPLQKGVVDTHDPHTTVVIPSVYFKGESDPYPAGIIYFTLKIGPSITATTDNGALVRDATWMEGNPRVSASLSSPVAVSNPRPTNGARRVMASLLRTKPKSPRMVEPSVGHVQSSGTYVLSALTPVNDLPAPLIFASLSKNAHGVPLILKKPLMVRNSNPHGQEVVAPLGCNPGAQWMDFDWNEPSGRLVLINSNQHHCEIMLYQF
ncbi:hypothetical protein DL93DRAFT_2226053 [Clavulina sp. PMI_390]|nr:hypothetical protein DL93DRAFT_2226053 [Clavulina sp. PMI_390]